MLSADVSDQTEMMVTVLFGILALLAAAIPFILLCATSGCCRQGDCDGVSANGGGRFGRRGSDGDNGGEDGEQGPPGPPGQDGQAGPAGPGQLWFSDKGVGGGGGGNRFIGLGDSKSGMTDDAFFSVAYIQCQPITITHLCAGVSNKIGIGSPPASSPGESVTFTLWISRCVGGILQTPVPTNATITVPVDSQNVCAAISFAAVTINPCDLVATFVDSTMVTGSFNPTIAYC